MLEAEDEAEALDLLHRERCTDGLPVVVPTEERVEQMLARVDVDPATVLGVVPPRLGLATVETVAVNAVMAGCPPAHFDLACAAVKAVCDPDFGLAVVQGTTHNAAPLLIVNGPARRREPAVAAEAGALGPGHRANLGIGRTVRLVLSNAGGGRPGEGDMATLGQPAKIAACIAEAEESSSLAPLVGASAVTALAAEGPHLVMFVPVGDEPGRDGRRLLDLVARTICAPGSIAGLGYTGSAAIVLSPLHADVLASAGLDREAIQAELHERAVFDGPSVESLHGWIRGSHDDLEAPRALASPDHALVAVAGGVGTYSAVFPGLAAGVSERVTVRLDSLAASAR